MDPEARKAFDDAYREALEYAKQDFDELQPQVDRLTKRLGQLRRLIIALSGLLDLEYDERFETPVQRGRSHSGAKPRNSGSSSAVYPAAKGGAGRGGGPGPGRGPENAP